MAIIIGYCRSPDTPERAFFYGLHPFPARLLEVCALYRSNSPAYRYRGRTVSVMVHDLFPSCPCIERKLCPERKRETASYGTHRFPVYCFVCPDCDRSFYFSAQNRFMRNHELGIDKDQILVASLPQMPYHSSPYRKFDTQLKSFAEIDDIAYAKWELGATEGYTQYIFRYKGNNYGHQYIDVTTNFCRVMGMHILSGKRLPAQRFHLHLPAKLYRHAGPSERKRYPGRRNTRLFPMGNERHPQRICE